MRGITVEGLKRMALQSQSWEYASEMVLKSSAPVDEFADRQFLVQRRGRHRSAFPK